MQPDAGPRRNGDRLLVAIQLRDGGGQDLVARAMELLREAVRREVEMQDVTFPQPEVQERVRTLYQE